ncbi:hypothetical protein PRIPAC_94349 [Pristionchus pacificus]|uniref:Uncharacterized protein n=1 Tax=Pristionchus pacificus TaxID=54126 RepID=A0A454XUB7_PRIPA|nr:hypothetical protein PRIPAC_94349 [Pristionchus pacificus]|eukprot:PDM67823.1 hypothetical protein PRIPAC_45867 [Pristionchus pacificus]
MLVFLLFFLLISTCLAGPLNHTKREVSAGDPFDLWIKGVQRMDRQSSIEIIKSCDVNLRTFEDDPKFGDSCYLWTKKALCCI